MTKDRTSSPSSLFKFQVPFHPWAYFVIFLVSNTLLSFFQLTLTQKLWTLLVGIILPLGVGAYVLCRKRRLQGSVPLSSLDPMSIPAWAWMLALGLLVLTRFYRLGSLPFWPLSDEGQSGFFGILQSQHWHWQLLWGQERIEPLWFWMLGLFFKLVQPSLYSMRLATVLLSILTGVAAYWAARQYFSPFSAFLFSWLLAFSFWELTLSRSSLGLLPVSPLQFLCLGLLGKFLRERPPSKLGRNFWLLSLLAGFGFYGWIAWGGMWMGMAAILAIHFLRGGKRDMKPLLYFGGISFLAALPITMALLAPGELDQVRQLASLPFSQAGMEYLSGTFWNGMVSFPFGSSWGGFFNPILGSLVFLGFLQGIRMLPPTVIAYGVILLVSTALPGITTRNVDLNRLMTFYPLLTALAVLGIHSLAAKKTGGIWKMILLMSVLGGCLGLDVYNYLFHYCDPAGVPVNRQWRNIQYFNAYQILQALHQDGKPLYVFSEFNTDYDNKTLDIADYPFNAAENPSLDHSHPQWAVIITNIQYAPYFIKRFSGVQSKVLKTDKTGPEDPKPFGIFLIPTSQIPSPMLDGWKQAAKIYQDIDFQTKNKEPKELWASPIQNASSLPDLAKQDPFLTAVYWEKTGFFNFLDGHFIQATDAYRNAVTLGIPAAHLYYDLGVCLRIQNRLSESQKYFQKAATLAQGKGR